MGKKEKLITSFNPNDFEVVQEPSVKPITEFDPNEFTVVSAPKQPLYKDTFTQVKEAQGKPIEINKTQQIVDNIPDLSDGHKKIIKDLAVKGIKGEELSNSILTLQGKHPKQDGGTKYYLNDKGIPVPIKNNERPPQGYDLRNVWGTQSEAEDDNKLTTFAKNIYNIIPSVVENVADIVHLPYVLGQTIYKEAASTEGLTQYYTPEQKAKARASTVEEADWYKGLKQSAKSRKMLTSTASNAPMLNTEGIDEFSDIFEGKNWHFTPDNIVGTVSSLAKTVGEFVAGGELTKGVQMASKGGQALSKAGVAKNAFTASYMTQLGDVIDAGKEAGLSTEDAYKFGSAVTIPLALVDIGMGVEGKIFSDQAAKAERGQLIKNLAKGFVKDSEGKITKEALDDAFKATLVSNASLVKTWGKETLKDALGEGFQEASQEFIQKAGEQLYDKLGDSDKKFGTDAFSAKAFADYLQNGIAGALGGAPTALAYNKVRQINRENEQSKSAFGIAQKGEEAINAFKSNIQNEVKAGKLTKEDADNAILRVNAYKEYNDQTADLNIPDNQKREIFDKTFQKANLEEHIKGLDPEKMNGIELAKYEGLKKQAKHLQEDINRIVLEAQIKEETIAGEKTIEEHEEEPVKEGKEEKKPILSPELQALKDRYKKPETVKEGKLPEQPKPEEDTRTIAEIPNEVFNHSQFNARTKHAKLADYLETVPDKKTLGVLKENVYTYAKKKNRTYEVELPDGKRIRLASSMLRDTGISGHFRTEHIKGKIAEFPVGVKVEYLPDGKKAIKIFNGKTGKFLSWAKATNTSKKDEWTDLQKDQLEHLSTIVEPPLLPSTEEITEPTKPVTPTNIENYAKDITEGKRILERFSPKEQRGISRGGQNHAEASVIVGAIPSTSGEASTVNEEQENRIEKYAKEKGIWIDNVNEKYGTPDASGEESLIWLNGNKVIKSQNTFLYGNLQEKLDSITLHNSLFPETALKVIGFGRNIDDDFQVIVEQPLIIAHPVKKATIADIKNYMSKLGFKNTEENNYANSETLIDDLHTGNVILTPKGNIEVIDPIIRLNTAEQGYGGTRITKPITPTNVQQINEKTTTGEKTVPATTSEAVEKGERKAKALRAGTKKANRKIRHPEKIQALNHDVFEPHGIAMQYFIGGGEIGSEAIKAMFKNAKGELNARISYIRKNGPTIDEIAHNLWEQHSELNFDTQDYANAVEDVVLSYNSSTAMAKDLNKQMSEGQDMRFNPLEEVINTEADIADNNGLGEQLDRAIDFLEEMSDEELIKLANDQEAFNNWYEENENKIEEGKDIIRDDGEGDQFQKPKSKKIIKPKKEEIGSGEKAYEKWKGENKEYEGAEIEEVKTGEKVMLTVYHGTTNEFYEFDSSVKGNIEGHLGKINYFTSDKGDAEMNYTSSGPDLTSRIEQRAERLEYDLEGKTDKEIAEEYDVKVKDLKGKSNAEKGRVIAEKELKGGEEKTLKLHIKLNNPVVLGKESTWVDVIPEAEYADHIPEAEEQIADENGISIEEARQDYSYGIRNRAIENSYTESPLLTALQDALNENGYSDKSASELLQDFLYEDSVDLSNLEKALRKAELYENENGDLASSQVIADFFKNLGYDGIILTDVSERFKNMGIGSYTSHIHVFDEFANQIKLADGTNKTYNEETKDIRFQKQKQDKGSVDIGSHEAVLKVTQHIQKVLPKIKVIYNNKLKAAGKLTADGKTIEINPYYAGSDTPIHEAGHVLIDAMGYGHVAIQAGVKQLKKTNLYKETKERYPELSEEMLNKEVLAEAIGREGADIFDSEVEKSKFKQVLEHIFNWLKQRLGLDKNVAKSLAKQIIGGIGTKKLGAQEELQTSLQKNKESLHRWIFSKPRGGIWTKEKILKALKKLSGGYKTNGNHTINELISEFDSPEEFKESIYYHGTGSSVNKGLKPSILMTEKQAEQQGGGGYGERYWAVSVSRNKNKASNFTGQSRYGTVYPVILKKGAKVISMPEIQDANELDDIIEKLWNEGVDAVKIGDWTSNYTEEELAVINPQAIFKYENPTSFSVYGKEKFFNLTDNQIKDIYDIANKQNSKWQELRKLGNSNPEKQKGIAELQTFQFQKTKTPEAVKAFDEANSKRGINRNTAMKEFKKNFPNLAPTIKLVTDNFKEIVNQLKQTRNLIEKC